MMYEAYAPYYDGSGQLRFAMLVGHYLQELLARHPVYGRHALDLACGTGTLALMLAESGWDVIGLDASSAMLAEARAKAASLEQTRHLRFVRGDLRAFVEPEGPVRASSCDLITCTYDSLNYLLDSAHLLRCFQQVALALKPGGLWVCDMNTPYFLEHDWAECEVIEQPGLIQISQSQFDPYSLRSMMLLTGMVGDDQQGYTRFDEIHVERAYPADLVAATLEQAGLQIEASYDSFTFQPPTERSQRIFWVARRPS